MESTGQDELAASLLQWVKSFEAVGSIAGWNDLSDGSRLWAILHDVDAEYFVGELPEPGVGAAGDWTRKWQNLKHLEKQITIYYRDICHGGDDLSANNTPDLKAIAAEMSVRHLEKLIMIMIRAAMASPESNQRMAQRLMALGREHAMIIANELRDMEEPDYTESESASRDESAYQSEQEMPVNVAAGHGKDIGGMYRDPLLEREEELLRAQATIDKLQASHANAQLQLHELRQDKDRLQEAFDNYRSEIDNKGRKTGDDSFKKLQRQTENDRAYIDDLEVQLQSSRGTLESYEKQLDRMKIDNDASQKLRDDLQMLRAENEDLNQKVRANENLKKKILTLQEHEKANATLREELKQSNERLEEVDRLKQVQASLEKEVIEKKGLIRNQEYQINELATVRKHAEYDARVLAQKLEAARERHERDHEAIEELRSKVQDASLEEADGGSTEQSGGTNVSDPVPAFRPSDVQSEESKHLAEKVALLQSQLEDADARLKQTSDRNTALEEKSRGIEIDADARGAAEQQLAEQGSVIAQLRKEVEEAAKKQADAASPDVAALQRENHLMATAWYDLAGRLQNNGVSLGRRRQEPKSWIGKQRALVGPNAGLQLK